MNEEQLRRLSDCEVIINKYHDQLKTYISQIENYTKNSISRSELEQTLEYLKKTWGDSFSNIQANLSKQDENHKELLYKVYDLKDKLNLVHLTSNKHMDSILRHNQEIENSCAQHEIHAQHIADIQAKFPEYDKISPKLDEFIQKSGEFALLCSKIDDELRKKFEGLDAKFQLCSSNNTMNQINLEDHKKQYQDQIKDFKFIIKTLNDNVQNQMNGLSAHFENRINKLPVPEKVQLPDFDKMLADQQVDTLEKVNLKARKIEAALEQAKSNEMQMTVMNKKMEKILEILSNNDFN